MDSIRAAKTKMLEEIHRIITIVLGEPPQSFDWNFRNKDKEFKEVKDLDPVSFYRTVVDYPLESTVSLINDPRNEYYRLYTVEYLGNVVGGRPVLYINVPIDQLKKYAVKSIKDNRPGNVFRSSLDCVYDYSVVWFGCDVSKFFHRPSGILDTKLFDLELTFGVQLNLNKTDRLKYGESSMTHAMTLTGVHLKDDVPQKWRIENSWGEEGGDKGYLCMTDEWFDEYMYQIVVKKSDLEADILSVIDQTPTALPPWVSHDSFHFFRFYVF